jgi:hypothetical protein
VEQKREDLKKKTSAKKQVSHENIQQQLLVSISSIQEREAAASARCCLCSAKKMLKNPFRLLSNWPSASAVVASKGATVQTGQDLWTSETRYDATILPDKIEAVLGLLNSCDSGSRANVGLSLGSPTSSSVDADIVCAAQKICRQQQYTMVGGREGGGGGGERAHDDNQFAHPPETTIKRTMMTTMTTTTIITRIPQFECTL